MGLDTNDVYTGESGLTDTGAARYSAFVRLRYKL